MAQSNRAPAPVWTMMPHPSRTLRGRNQAWTSPTKNKNRLTLPAAAAQGIMGYSSFEPNDRCFSWSIYNASVFVLSEQFYRDLIEHLVNVCFIIQKSGVGKMFLEGDSYAQQGCIYLFF